MVRTFGCSRYGGHPLDVFRLSAEKMTRCQMFALHVVTRVSCPYVILLIFMLLKNTWIEFARLFDILLRGVS